MKRYEFKNQDELLAATILLIKDHFNLDLKIDKTNRKRPALIADLSPHQESLLQSVKPAFILIQEGGSSSELYLHSHSSMKDAEADRISCADDGAYRTSPVVEISPALAALGENFYSAAELLLQAQDDLECVEVPEADDDDNEEEQATVERPGA